MKTFVANGVTKIQQITKSLQLRHVHLNDNLADIIYKGQLPADFT